MTNGTDLSDFSMLDLFRMELENQLAVISRGLIEMEGRTPSMQELDSLMRAAHSIKGAARMVNVPAAVRVSHGIEDSFVAAQKGRLHIKAEQVDILLNGVDFLHQLETADDDAILSWHEKHADDLQQLETNLSLLVNSEQDEGYLDVENEIDRQLLKHETEKQENESSEETAESQETLRVDASRLSKIFSLAGESLVESHRFNKSLNDLIQLKISQHKLIEEMDALRNALQDHNLNTQTKNYFNTVYSHALSLRQEFSDRIADLDALDRRTTSVSEKLHKEIMSTRMRPISWLVQPLPRLVRDLARKLEKQVRIHMSGLATPVDREVLERIDSSIKHLVQNAADHGIESPEVRKELGKPAIGNIYINVSQSAGMLFIVIHDDGVGVDLPQLRKKIVKKGLASKEHLEELSDEDVLQYLFEPGFSTRSRVSEISGRGVGLDLVKETVNSLGGNVFVASDPGHGTRFQLLLPQTVSIMRVLLSTVAGESYSFPLSRIHRLLMIDTRLISLVEDRVFFDTGQGLLELFHANYLLDKPVTTPADKTSVPVVVLEEDDKQIGLILEAVQGEKELSIQRWDPELGEVPGVNSAAILDEGELTLIIDTRYMREIAVSLTEPVPEMLEWFYEVREDDRMVRVLLHESSKTARERVRRILQRMGLHVDFSRDVEDAFSRLENNFFDLFVCGLNGKDSGTEKLLKECRNSSINKSLPTLVLSDLEGGEKEERVFEERFEVIYKADFKPSQFVSIIKQWTRDE